MQGRDVPGVFWGRAAVCRGFRCPLQQWATVDRQFPWPTAFPIIQGGICWVQNKWLRMGRSPVLVPLEAW